MTNQQRLLRLAFLSVWVGAGYWMGGGLGALSMLTVFIFVYWVGCLAVGFVQGIQRMQEPRIQIDKKVLNMNVDPELARKGTRIFMDERHRDPTRPQ